MDYLSPIFNETAYCLAVEKLLGIEVARARDHASACCCMELNRIAQPPGRGFATGGMELGALTAMTNGFRERELILDVLEMITGLRMNHAYVRPGGVAQDLPPGAVEKIRELLDGPAASGFDGIDDLLTGNPIWQAPHCRASRHLDVQGCLALGVTGPILRSAGLAWDLRKAEPYCGYESYDFDVADRDRRRRWGRFLRPHAGDVRVAEDRRAGARQAAARPGHGRGHARSPGRRSSRSAPTAWASRSTT